MNRVENFFDDIGGVWFYEKVAFDNDLTATEKLIYSIILDTQKIYSIDNLINKEFSYLLKQLGVGCTQVIISRGITKLKNKGYIEVDYKIDNQRIIKIL